MAIKHKGLWFLVSLVLIPHGPFDHR